MAVMVVELYEALKEAGASDAKAQAAARAMADYDAPPARHKIDTGLAEVKAQITMLEMDERHRHRRRRRPDHQDVFSVGSSSGLQGEVPWPACEEWFLVSLDMLCRSG